MPSGAASAFFPLTFFFLLHSAAPGVQSAAPGAAGSADAGAPWAPSCFFRVEIFADWASWSCRNVSKSVSEMKMDSDSGDGVMDGFLICLVRHLEGWFALLIRAWIMHLRLHYWLSVCDGIHIPR